MNKHEQEFDEMLRRVRAASKAYDSFDSTMEWDDSVMDFDDDDDTDSVLNMVGDRRFAGLSQFDFRCEYVSGGLNAPVNVTIGQPNNNPGTVTGNTLVFTNGTDTAIVRGDTTSFVFWQQEMIIKPFKAMFARMNVVNAAQFSNVWTFDKSTAWGGGKDNTLNPNSQLTPEQFQLLRVDLELNYRMMSNQGFSFNLGPTEVAASGGTRITIFADKIMEPGRALQNKPQVLQMRPNRVSPGPSMPTAQAISQLAKMQAKQMKILPALLSKMKR